MKRKKGGGLKVKIQFPPVSKEIQELASTPKESRGTSRNETATSTTTALQMSPTGSTSPADSHPTSTESAKSTSRQPNSLSGSSSSALPPLQDELSPPQRQTGTHTDSSESDGGN